MPLPQINDDDFDRIKRDYPFPNACPTCGDTFKYKLGDVEVPCDCRRQKNLTKHYFVANIGKRYHTLSLDDFVSPDSEEIKPIITNYLENFEDNYFYGLGYVLAGGFGTGKTLVACHILKVLIQRGYHCYFVQFPDLIDIWGKRWSDDDASRALESNMKRAQVLVIDDLATDKRNYEKFLESGLEAVVRYRYNNSLPTIITTNLNQEQQMLEFPRVFSLLSGINEWVWFKSNIDHRPGEYKDRITNLANEGERLPVV